MKFTTVFIVAALAVAVMAQDEPALIECDGINEAAHLQCQEDTGCSGSYCKGSVCHVCEPDAPAACGGQDCANVLDCDGGRVGLCDTSSNECTCGEFVDEQAPECRRAFKANLDDEEEIAHLVNREDGSMGCINDFECQFYTSSDSSCNEDGTCRGCDDWTGCCEIEGATTGVALPCAFGDEDADDFCKFFYGDCSYCAESGSCYDCEDPVPPCDCSVGDFGCAPGVQALCNENDECECGTIINSGAPLCRLAFKLNPEDDEEQAHLVTRNEEGAMGCLDHSECHTYTDASSWCTADGTCAGCEDWTGCCVLEDGNPAQDECDFGSDGADAVCQDSLGQDCSYCKSDNTCHVCVDPQSSAISCNPNDGMMADVGCKVNAGCIGSYCKDNGVCKEC